jgi:hypothetical protein
MIGYYGINNFSFLWRVPRRYRKVFSRFLIRETRPVRNLLPKEQEALFSGPYTHGIEAWNEWDVKNWEAILDEYKDQPDESPYDEILFVGKIVSDLDVEDVELLRELAAGARDPEDNSIPNPAPEHSNPPVASSSKVTLDH